MCDAIFFLSVKQFPTMRNISEKYTQNVWTKPRLTTGIKRTVPAPARTCTVAVLEKNSATTFAGRLIFFI